MALSCSHCGAPLPGGGACAYCGQAGSANLPVDVPAPGMFQLIDHGEKLLNVTVTAVGADPASIVRHVASRAPDISAVRSIHGQNGWRREMYLRLRLNEIRGFGLRVHVFAAADDQLPWNHPFFASHVRASEAVLVSASSADRNEPWSAALLSWLRAGLASRKTPFVALCGPPELTPAWSRHFGISPVYAGPDPLAALRELARASMRRLADG